MPNQDLDRLRRTVNKGIVVLIWLHLPVLACIGLATGTAWGFTCLFGLVLAVAATGTWWIREGSQETRLTIAVALVAMASLIVNQLSGHPWQLDSHMYLFAVLAILGAYCDWRVLLMAAGAIALHHLVLNFLLPAAIYPGGADFGRVVLHAVIVVLETTVLIWLAQTLASLFNVSANALKATEAARAAEVAALARETQIHARAEAAKEQSQSELNLRFEAEIGGVVEAMVIAAKDVQTASDGLSGHATAAAESSARIVQGSDNASASVNAVAAAAEQLSSSVSEIANRIGRAADIARQAEQRTVQTSEGILRLKEMANRIGTAVELINGIAGQTNLLALNAPIEAARAAEAGKGFAVVASEVKALANQTTKATDDIRAQIADIQNETHRAVAAIRGISQIIADLGGITAAVATAAEQQRVATAAIAQSAQQAAVGTQAIAESLSELARATSETGAGANSGRRASEWLNENCERMTNAVHGFVVTLRAA